MKNLNLILTFGLLALMTCGCEPMDSQSVTSGAGSGDVSHRDLVTEVGTADFEKVIADNTITLVDFTATWCGPCQQLKPELHKMAEEFDGKIKFVEVDVDKSRDIAEKYKITDLPTLVVIKNGEEASRTVGADSQEIRDMLENAL